MTFLFSGDWHLCPRNLDNCRKVVEQVCSLLDADATRGPRYFVHLGDIVGDRGPCNPMDVRCTNFLIDAIPEIRSRCTDAFFVRGNHDPITTQDGSPSCVPLLRTLGMKTADNGWSSETFLLRTFKEGARLWMVPYFRDPVRQKAMFRAARSQMMAYQGTTKFTNILVFHNEVKGCERNARSKGEGLTLEDIGAADYDLCVAGHIHRPQFMEPNLHFVGSPFSMDWSEINAEKRFLKVEI